MEVALLKAAQETLKHITGLQARLNRIDALILCLEDGNDIYIEDGDGYNPVAVGGPATIEFLQSLKHKTEEVLKGSQKRFEEM
jgi:hypothetical protein